MLRWAVPLLPCSFLKPGPISTLLPQGNSVHKALSAFLHTVAFYFVNAICSSKGELASCIFRVVWTSGEVGVYVSVNLPTKDFPDRDWHCQVGSPAGEEPGCVFTAFQQGAPTLRGEPALGGEARLRQAEARIHPLCSEK